MNQTPYVFVAKQVTYIMFQLLLLFSSQHQIAKQRHNNHRSQIHLIDLNLMSVPYFEHKKIKIVYKLHHLIYLLDIGHKSSDIAVKRVFAQPMLDLTKRFGIWHGSFMFYGPMGVVNMQNFAEVNKPGESSINSTIQIVVSFLDTLIYKLNTQTLKT